MYCGDETGSFIGDIGTRNSRFGYGGEDSPRYVITSYVDTKTKTIPTSCYNSKWALDNNSSSTSLKCPLRTVQSPTPIVNPIEYLQQGDIIENWDAYENIWTNALNTMRVYDTLKHTKGGKETTTTTAASGMQSTTIRTSASVKASTESSRCIHPILVVSPGCTYSVGSNVGERYQQSVRRKQLINITEIMIEKLNTGAVFIAPTPMLSAFAHGRQTCVIADIGASGTRVTPVVDGLVLNTAQRRNGRGSDWLDNIQWNALIQLNKTIIRPRYQLQNNYINSTKSSSNINNNNNGNIFHRWAMQDLMYELRTCEHIYTPEWWYDTSIPFIYNNNNNNNKDSSSSSSSNNNSDNENDDKMEIEEEETGGTKHFELPDGTLVDLTNKVGKDICRIPELLFTDDTPFLTDNMKTYSNNILNEHITLSNLPIHKLIHNSISAVGDIDIRKELTSNIILTGGCSVTRNIEKRLSIELPRVITSSAYKTKVIASKFNIERQYSSWIGGSILTSLGSFQQLWLSKTEYEEYGSTLAIQRFP